MDESVRKGPIAASYWLVDGMLLAGEYPGSNRPEEARSKLSKLLDAGIRTFVNLTETTEPLKPDDDVLAELAAERGLDLKHVRYSVADRSVPRERGLMVSILETIRESIEEEQCDYVCGWDSRIGAYDPRRYRGAMLGLAVGDALGAALEFKRPGSFTPISDMIGGGPFTLAAGEWTDDTSMALCLAESLLETGGFDPADQLTRYVRWWKDGHHSSNGSCFDIGNTVRESLREFLRTADPNSSAASHPFSAGNGSLMRLAPVPLFYATDPQQAIAMSAASSKTTHAHPEAVDACRYFGGLIVAALAGASKDDLLSPGFSPVPGLWDRQPLVGPIADVAAGSFMHRAPPEIEGSGYVTRSLEAALWAFAHAGSFEEGALLAVNLGNDADTTGAIYGQIAGAFFGVDDIPERWRSRLVHLELLEEFARGLFRANRGSTGP